MGLLKTHLKVKEQRNYTSESLLHQIFLSCQCLFVLFSELNVASVDPDLFVLLARNVAKTVQLYVSKCEQLVSVSYS